MKSIDLYLVRHGNTFDSGQKIVWVGSKENPPLTSHGRAQARSVATYFKTKEIIPQSVYSGPLLRATQFAYIIAEETKFSDQVQISHALNELDYGDWSGKSNEEIIAAHGERKFKDWDERGIWPDGCSWGSDQQTIINETKKFISSLTSASVLAVTSNGRLRFFARLAGIERPEKVKTGHLCHLQLSADSIKVVSWNIVTD